LIKKQHTQILFVFNQEKSIFLWKIKTLQSNIVPHEWPKTQMGFYLILSKL